MIANIVIIGALLAWKRPPALARTLPPEPLLGGLGWIAVLTSLNVSAQIALPNWVRARDLSIFIMVFFGCMAADSVVWGQVATYTSLPTALLAAAVGALVAIPLTWRSKLGQAGRIPRSEPGHELGNAGHRRTHFGPKKCT